MSSLNTNKIAAAILCAGLIGMVTGKVTEFLYDGGPKHPGAHEQVRGYTLRRPTPRQMLPQAANSSPKNALPATPSKKAAPTRWGRNSGV
jgi:hypothetical protein